MYKHLRQVYLRETSIFTYTDKRMWNKLKILKALDIKVHVLLLIIKITKNNNHKYFKDTSGCKNQ